MSHAAYLKMIELIEYGHLLTFTQKEELIGLLIAAASVAEVMDDYNLDTAVEVEEELGKACRLAYTEEEYGKVTDDLRDTKAENERLLELLEEVA
mgnify:CR=1 FL=1